MTLPDPMVIPIAYELLDCLEQEVSKVADPPNLIGLRTGDVVDHLLAFGDDECCQGLAWVRPVDVFPSSGTAGAWPAQDNTPLARGVISWAFVLEMGVIRCAPTPDMDSIPTVVQWNSVTEAVMADAAAMRRALCCYLDGAPERRASMLALNWRPLPISGGCVGGVMTATFKGPECDCAEAGGS